MPTPARQDGDVKLEYPGEKTQTINSQVTTAGDVPSAKDATERKDEDNKD